MQGSDVERDLDCLKKTIKVEIFFGHHQSKVHVFVAAFEINFTPFADF